MGRGGNLLYNPQQFSTRDPLADIFQNQIDWDNVYKIASFDDPLVVSQAAKGLLKNYTYTVKPNFFKANENSVMHPCSTTDAKEQFSEQFIYNELSQAVLKAKQQGGKCEHFRGFPFYLLATYKILPLNLMLASHANLAIFPSQDDSLTESREAFVHGMFSVKPADRQASWLWTMRIILKELIDEPPLATRLKIILSSTDYLPKYDAHEWERAFNTLLEKSICDSLKEANHKSITCFEDLETRGLDVVERDYRIQLKKLLKNKQQAIRYLAGVAGLTSQETEQLKGARFTPTVKKEIIETLAEAMHSCDSQDKFANQVYQYLNKLI